MAGFLTLLPTLARAVAGAALAAGAVISTPSLANSSATADVQAPLRTAASAKQSALGSGDEQFRNLFSSWQALDRGTIAAPSRATVSIPSRMPVEGVRLTSDFGMRNHPVLGGRRAHNGIDLAGPTGTPIYATADGIVEKADWNGGYGLYVQIGHGGELETRYGHMSRLNVAYGQRVRKGQLIGFVGSTGRSTGPHLHYEVRVAGQPVNPVPYMQADSFQRAFAAAQPAMDAVGGPE